MVTYSDGPQSRTHQEIAPYRKGDPRSWRTHSASVVKTAGFGQIPEPSTGPRLIHNQETIKKLRGSQHQPIALILLNIRVSLVFFDDPKIKSQSRNPTYRTKAAQAPS